MFSELLSNLANISVVFGFAIAIAGFLFSWNIARQYHTINLLISFFVAPERAKGEWNIHKMCMDHKKILNEELTEETRRDLRSALMFNELISILYFSGRVDKSIVDGLHGPMMVELYKLSEDYIKETRCRLGRQTLYSEYEKYVDSKQSIRKSKRLLGRHADVSVSLKPSQA
jgi:hypothetical protein